jgi:hypothetical protein
VLGHRPRLATAALVAVFGLLPAACGGDDGEAADEDDPASTAPAEESSTTADATTTVPSVEAEVEAAYLAYWEMNERLAGAPNPADPEIERLSMGTARDRLVSGLTGFVTKGQTVRFNDAYAHDILSIDRAGETAGLRDCYVDDATVLDADSGEELESATSTLYLEVTLTHTPDGWKVSEVERLRIWDGVAQCE